MKKLIFISLVAFYGCGKDSGQCSVCTTVISNSITGSASTTIKQTEYHGESSGNCTMTQEEFKSQLESETSDQVEILSSQGIDASYSVNCKYE